MRINSIAFENKKKPLQWLFCLRKYAINFFSRSQVEVSTTLSVNIGYFGQRTVGHRLKRKSRFHVLGSIRYRVQKYWKYFGTTFVCETTVSTYMYGLRSFGRRRRVFDWRLWHSPTSIARCSHQILLYTRYFLKDLTSCRFFRFLDLNHRQHCLLFFYTTRLEYHYCLYFRTRIVDGWN